jgi:peptide-methionine (S)-S-oxide reductase
VNTSCPLPGANRASGTSFPDPARDAPATGERAEAVLAGGCFWCTEAVYRQLDGVDSVESGYAGGTADTANYRAVCSGTTGHAEAIRIVYDPRRLSYGQLLKVFFSAAHDPTQRNRQGNDHGPQYRSAIFFADEAQREVAASYIAQLPAESCHQDYAARNPDQPYIAAVSAPKVEKVRKLFADRLKR